jgi:hypothetical protein
LHCSSKRLLSSLLREKQLVDRLEGGSDGLAPTLEELNHLHFATPALQRCRILRGESPAKQRQLKANSTSGAEISSHIKAKQQHDTKHGQNHL